MIDAIVYHSKSGHTFRYAQELANRVGIPALSIKEAKKQLKSSKEVLFMSWVKEDKIVKYNKMSSFHLVGVIAVGILKNEEDMLSRLRVENQIYTKLFYLQGGINKKKVGLFNKLSLRRIENQLAFEKLDSGLTNSKLLALEAINKNLDYTNFADLEPIIKYYRLTKEEFVS